ncbi:MAG TPA: HemK/PrmC family methyltransferase [Candidatus Saccharimonadales bacterium]
MTVDTWLTDAAEYLAGHDVPSARLDAVVLLEDMLKQDRAYILAHPELTIAKAQHAQLQKQLERRARHEPLGYIRGRSEFYGRDFFVNNTVLEPRPESETIIDVLKRLPKMTRIADIGTGSGALAITAKLELPECEVAAVDIDPACLHVAEQNANKHGAKLPLFTGDLLEPFMQESADFAPDVLLCNLPYVPDDLPINQAATHEPSLALFGGPDGLDLFRRLFKQIDQLSTRPVVIAESLPSQHAALSLVAQDHGYQQQAEDGFIQLFSLA